MRLPPALELARPLNCMFTGVAVLIGVAVTVGLNVSGLVLLLAFGAAALVAAGGNAINDYFDRKIDKINRPDRPIPSGKITPRKALVLALVFFAIGISLTVFLNPYCLLLAELNALMLVVYAAKLKRVGLSGNLTIGYLVGSTFLFGGLATAYLRVGPLIPSGLLILVLMSALSTVGRELIKGIEDMRGDRKLRFKTFPLRHGSGKAAVLAIGFIGTAIIISPLPYLLGIFGWTYLAPVGLSIAAFIAAAAIIARSQKPEVASRASLACKIGMGLGLLAFLAGVLANIM